jgi:hypothetical protein
MNGIYDSNQSLGISVEQLTKLMQGLGCEKLYVKALAPNDNSKNQPYMAGHLNDLNNFYKGDIITSVTTSEKIITRNNRIKYQVDFPFTWVDPAGLLYRAPRSKLIYYPQYPEVRFSGFLMGSKVLMGPWMDPKKRGRTSGRWLIVGVKQGSMNYGFLATPESRIANQLQETSLMETSSAFSELVAKDKGTLALSAKDALVSSIKNVWQAGWISGQRLSPTEGLIPYNARNAGGYTIEAALGIVANGIAGPDLYGWEIKQYSSNITTLMDSSPDGGFYNVNGIIPFIREYGYPDRNGISDRLNFGGVHKCGTRTPITGLSMIIDGYDDSTNSIIKADGSISLVTDDLEIAASWTFEKLMNHWQNKHARTVFVPSKVRKTPSGPEYAYGPILEFGEGANFTNLLRSYHQQFVYYDPGLKLENQSQPRPRSKARHPMRVKHRHLESLYDTFEITDLSNSIL